MMRLLFRNRWIALLWASSVLLSMAGFVSEDGGTAQVEAAAEQIRAKKSLPPSGSPAAPQDEDGSFIPDDELDAQAGPEMDAEPSEAGPEAAAE